MTVSYTAEVATCSGLGCFVKLLFKWRGSIYKLVWADLLCFLLVYFGLSLVYRFFLTPDQQLIFEQVARYCDKYGNLIPVSFVLGFYVSIVVERWWDQYRAIPWPDSIAVFVSSNIQGQDEKSRLMRRTIMRYVCLALTMVFTLISPRIKKRFPTYEHFVEAGLLLDNEKEIIEDMNRSVPGYSKHWLPIVWAASIVTRARKEGKIRDDFAVKTIHDELNKFRGGCGLLTSYDWISVPLVYTQVVTLAVYSYFVACIMGRQWLHPDRNPETQQTKGGEEVLDLFFPIFTTLQFFFYMGWLKVAESLVNPFGDDDDDFELNWMVDRDLQVSYLIVDEMHNNHPELLKDQYWDSVFPTELPHTVASEKFKEEVPLPSTSKVEVTKKDGEIVSPPSVLHMSESGIFMTSPNKRRESLGSIGEQGGAGGDKSAVFFQRSNNVIPQKRSFSAQANLARAVHSFPVKMGEQAEAFVTTTHRRPQTAVDPLKPGSIRRHHAGSIRSNASRSSLGEQSTAPPSRSGSMTSLLRRVFSRGKELNNEPKTVEDYAKQWAGNTITVQQRNVAEDVIEELDENQTTILSMKGERKPTAKEVFAGTGSPPLNIPSPQEEGGDQRTGRFTHSPVPEPAQEFFQGTPAPDRVEFTLGSCSASEQSSPEDERAPDISLVPIAQGEADDGSDGDSSEITLLHPAPNSQQ